MTRLAAMVAVALTAWPVRAASAERPSFEPPDAARTFARPGGPVVVHYAVDGPDAVLPADLDATGVPDFVEEVADRGAEVLDALDELGFRRPVPDGAVGDNGGDERIDIYLRALGQADGEFRAESCTEVPHHCTGYLVMENDFVGYPYATPSLGIRVLVSHEMFHAVQAAYDADQGIAWSEGTAVWAEERLYPEQDDFERLAAGFLAKPFRPFERTASGFGDAYPYGAGLWAHFLALRFGDDLIPEVWERCEQEGQDDPGFLDAIDDALAARGSSLASAWIEFTRWNAETGAHAAPGRYPGAGQLPLALREAALAAPGTAVLSIEGMSARYLPVAAGGGQVRITLEGAEIAATVRAVGASVRRSDGAAVDAVATRHELIVEAGAREIEVIATGVARGGLPRRVTVTVAVEMPPPPPPDPEPEPEPDSDDGGCAAGGGQAPGVMLASLWILWLARRGARRLR